MTAALVTAIYDGYDELKPLPELGDVDAVCVTDTPDLAAEGWRIVYEPRQGLHPNRAAKIPKLCPWRYTAADQSVWIDAAYRVVDTDFVTEAIKFADPIAQFVHPWRNCIYPEAEVSIQMGKYGSEPIHDQAFEYRTNGHPGAWGLWATGCIARLHTSKVIAFGNAWLSEIDRWSFQDQVSEPVALRSCGLYPSPLPGDHLTNPWLSYEASGRH